MSELASQFFDSINVKIFPSFNRGGFIEDGSETTLDVVLDPEARISTEYNFSHIPGLLLGGDTYVIESTSEKLRCVIHGYYFEITGDEVPQNSGFLTICLKDSPILESAQLDKIWTTSTLAPMSLKSGGLTVDTTALGLDEYLEDSTTGESTTKSTYKCKAIYYSTSAVKTSNEDNYNFYSLDLSDKYLRYVEGKKEDGTATTSLQIIEDLRALATGGVGDEQSARLAADKRLYGADIPEDDSIITIAGLDGRLDTAEGTLNTLTGSVAKALRDAKAYADGLASNYDAAGSATAALNEANAHTEEEVEKLMAKDFELYIAIGKNTDAIGTEETARKQADKDITDSIGGSFNSTYTVAKAINDAQAAAIDAQAKVDTLANNQVKNNSEAIEALQEALGLGTGTPGEPEDTSIPSRVTQAETDIDNLETKVDANSQSIDANAQAISAETKARASADAAIAARLDAVETFFTTAEGETLDSALDTLKEIQDYLMGEGEATGGILSRVGQAEADIDGLQAEFADGGRVNVVEGKISVLEGDRGTIATGDADTLAKAKSYTDGEVATLKEKDIEIENAVQSLQAALPMADQVYALEATIRDDCLKKSELDESIGVYAVAFVSQEGEQNPNIETRLLLAKKADGKLEATLPEVSEVFSGLSNYEWRLNGINGLKATTVTSNATVYAAKQEDPDATT